MTNDLGTIVFGVLEIWSEADNYNKEEVLEKVLRFAEDVKCKGNNLINYIRDELEDERSENNKCPDCGEILGEPSATCEVTGEYMGFPVTSITYTKKCLFCGWAET